MGINEYISMVSCQKGPTRHAYAWQIGPFWQDTLDINLSLQKWDVSKQQTRCDGDFLLLGSLGNSEVCN